jgi:hypothetical protein
MNDLIKISEEILLNELFSNPYDYEEIGNYDDGYAYEFESKGNTIIVYFSDYTTDHYFAVENKDKNPTSPSLDAVMKNIKDFEKQIKSFDTDGVGDIKVIFKRNTNMIVDVDFWNEETRSNSTLNRFTMTKSNDAMRVIATVIQIMKEHAEKFNIFAYKIQGASERHDQAYKKILNYLVRKEGYQKAQINIDTYLLRTKERMR